MVTHHDRSSIGDMVENERLHAVCWHSLRQYCWFPVRHVRHSSAWALSRIDTHPRWRPRRSDVRKSPSGLMKNLVRCVESRACSSGYIGLWTRRWSLAVDATRARAPSSESNEGERLLVVARIRTFLSSKKTLENLFNFDGDWSRQERPCGHPNCPKSMELLHRKNQKHTPWNRRISGFLRIGASWPDVRQFSIIWRQRSSENHHNYSVESSCPDRFRHTSSNNSFLNWRRYITEMCNRSLRDGWLPVSQRHAIITPIIKKEGLSAEDLKSYRPISNLTHISKLVERLVSLQMTTFLEQHGLLSNNQSGFRKRHSTETATLKMISDILTAADQKK